MAAARATTAMSPTPPLQVAAARRAESTEPKPSDPALAALQACGRGVARVRPAAVAERPAAVAAPAAAAPGRAG
eukprot:3623655-Prymnesium_polylepis.1